MKVERDDYDYFKALVESDLTAGKGTTRVRRSCGRGKKRLILSSGEEASEEDTTEKNSIHGGRAIVIAVRTRSVKVRVVKRRR